MTAPVARRDHTPTPIADQLLAEAAASGMSDETWLWLAHALGEVQ